MAKAKKKAGEEQEVELEPGIQPGHSIRADGKVFEAGDEDELAEVLTSEDAERLEEKGVIHGIAGKAKPAKAEK